MPRTPAKTQWWGVVRKQDGHCWYCGYKPEVLTDLTVDHAVPQCRGGKNDDWNLLPACEYCNRLKDNLTISEFRKLVKALIVRNMLSLGYVGGDLRKVKIVFYGEGNSSPFGF